MLLLLNIPKILSETEYDELKERQRTLFLELEKLQAEISSTHKALRTQMIFHEPSVILGILKNKNGDKWLGRVRIPDELLPYFSGPKGDRYYVSFTVCNAAEFADKEDPQLKKLAVEVAKKTLRKRFGMG